MQYPIILIVLGADVDVLRRKVSEQEIEVIESYSKHITGYYCVFIYDTLFYGG